jgi:hypothetical protein
MPETAKVSTKEKGSMMRFGLGDTSGIASQIQAAAPAYGVPPSLALALAQKESSLDPNAVSPAGAQGLFQLMPATGASLGVSNPFDPSQSIQGGLSYLKSLYNQYGNWNDALIAYNEGPGTFSKGTIYPSSQSYADSILAASGVSDSAITDPTSDSFAAVDTFPGELPLGLSGLAWAGIAVAFAGLALLFLRE